MTPKHNTPLTAALTCLAIGAALVLGASDALAQRGGGRGGFSGGGFSRGGGFPRGFSGFSSIGSTQLNRVNGGFSTGLQGVRAELPRPIANRGSLLPPTPGFHGSHGNRPFVDPRSGKNFPGTDAFRFSQGRNLGNDPFFGTVGSNGFRVRGSVTGDHFRLGFDLNPGLNSGFFHDNRFGNRFGNFNNFCSPVGRFWPFSDLWGWSYWNNYNDGYYYPQQPVYSQPLYIDPALLALMQQQQQTPPSTTPANPPTPQQLADQALYDGRISDAVKAYREHLEHYPEDTAAMRSLAVALVQDKRVKEAVAVMAMAYEKDLSLVRHPLDPNMVAGGEDAFRDVLRSSVLFSNRVRTASAYLMVTVLMQGEHRNEQALKILEKAKNAGLSERLATELETELSR